MMPRRSSRSRLSTLAALCLVIAASLTARTAAQTEAILHSFAGGPSGADPTGSLIFDPQGNLYGVTQNGGHIGGRNCGGCGVVYELSPDAGGAWKETVLTEFTWFNGAFPQAGLVRDAAGNLYGTALDGGYLCSCGVVFELSPTSTGAWKQTVLHSFRAGTGGFFPSSPLTLDAAGNLYGTATLGGSSSSGCNCGVVFELSPTSSGKWNEKLLYTFTGIDGAYPSSGVTLDAAGNLYGETSSGGPGAEGTVFKLSPTKSGPWAETILLSFSSNGFPSGGVIFDPAGNLYGATQGMPVFTSCSPNCGSVFELAPNSDGTWTETVLYAFGGQGDGAFPLAGLVFDSGGNLYGTTSNWGDGYGLGTIFELMPTSSGSWNFVGLYGFKGPPHDGEAPASSLILDSAGNLYGTALGGPGGLGIVYKITP
jgi:hypothetical protein